MSHRTAEILQPLNSLDAFICPAEKEWGRRGQPNTSAKINLTAFQSRKTPLGDLRCSELLLPHPSRTPSPLAPWGATPQPHGTAQMPPRVWRHVHGAHTSGSSGSGKWEPIGAQGGLPAPLEFGKGTGCTLRCWDKGSEVQDGTRPLLSPPQRRVRWRHDQPFISPRSKPEGVSGRKMGWGRQVSGLGISVPPGKGGLGSSRGCGHRGGWLCPQQRTVTLRCP